MADGKTPYERRFGELFKGQVIPFGAVDFHPMSAKESRLHQGGKKVSPGIFLGYALVSGRIWKGDILFADIEDQGEEDASEIHARRLNAKDIFTKDEQFIFPIADGTAKLC